MMKQHRVHRKSTAISPSADAIDFLAATKAASTMQLSKVRVFYINDRTLLIEQHQFLRNPPRTNELIQLVLFAQLSAYRMHKKMNQSTVLDLIHTVSTHDFLFVAFNIWFRSNTWRDMII